MNWRSIMDSPCLIPRDGKATQRGQLFRRTYTGPTPFDPPLSWVLKKYNSLVGSIPSPGAILKVPGRASLVWSGRWDLNPRQLAWEARTLPLSYARSLRFDAHLRFRLRPPQGQVLLRC